MKILIFAPDSIAEEDVLTMIFHKCQLSSTHVITKFLVLFYELDPYPNNMRHQAKQFAADLVILLYPTAGQIAEGLNSIHSISSTEGTPLLFLGINPEDSFGLQLEELEIMIENGEEVSEQEYFRGSFN